MFNVDICSLIAGSRNMPPNISSIESNCCITGTSLVHLVTAKLISTLHYRHTLLDSCSPARGIDSVEACQACRNLELATVRYRKAVV